MNKSILGALSAILLLAAIPAQADSLLIPFSASLKP